MNTKRKGHTIETLVGIQADEYRRIEFTHSEFDSLAEDRKTVERVEGFSIHVHDGEGLHIFSFEDAHEAKTFAKRMLEQADMFI